VKNTASTAALADPRYPAGPAVTQQPSKVPRVGQGRIR
jgi:hypothetical protein